MTNGRKRILVIEDEPDTIEMFAEMMHLSGFVVEKVYSAEIALDDIVATRPDVIILDRMMPGQSGLELLRQMRADARLSVIPVVMVSAMGLPQDVEAGIEAGASIYLAKPVSFRQLRDAVHSVLKHAG